MSPVTDIGRLVHDPESGQNMEPRVDHVENGLEYSHLRDHRPPYQTDRYFRYTEITVPLTLSVEHESRRSNDRCSTVLRRQKAHPESKSTAVD